MQLPFNGNECGASVVVVTVKLAACAGVVGPSGPTLVMIASNSASPIRPPDLACPAPACVPRTSFVHLNPRLAPVLPPSRCGPDQGTTFRPPR